MNFRKLFTLLIFTALSLSAKGDCQTQCCDRLFVNGDLLLMRVDGNALAYGIAVKSNQIVNTQQENTFPLPIAMEAPPVAKLKTKNLNCDYNAGFRIGFLYALPCSRWNIGIKYMNYSNSKSDHFCTPCPFTSSPFAGASGGLLPLYGISPIVSMTGATKEATAKWNSCFNIVDVEASKPFRLDCAVSLTPFAGVRFASIGQKYNIDYLVQQLLLPPTNPDHLFQVRMKNNYKGAGVLLGFEAEWKIGCGVSLYTKGSSSLVYGNFNLEQNLINKTAPNQNPVFPPINDGSGGPSPRLAPSSFLEDNFCSTRAISNYAIGLQWHCCMPCYTVYAKVLWEQYFFPGQNQHARLWYGSTNNHDLGLSGVSFSLGLEF